MTVKTFFQTTLVQRWGTRCYITNVRPQKNSLLSEFDEQSDQEMKHIRSVKETIPEPVIEEDLDNKVEEETGKSKENEEFPIQDSGQLNIGISYHPLKQSLEIFIS